MTAWFAWPFSGSIEEEDQEKRDARLLAAQKCG
jgi:hypothetical protein